VLRVVRDVHRYESKVYLKFAIRHCSWTTRPYTVYYSGDQYLHRLRPTGKRKQLGNRIDKMLAASFVARTAADCPLRCHQVRGIA